MFYQIVFIKNHKQKSLSSVNKSPQVALKDRFSYWFMDHFIFLYSYVFVLFLLWFLEVDYIRRNRGSSPGDFDSVNLSM